jgi:hypothetical protein
MNAEEPGTLEKIVLIIIALALAGMAFLIGEKLALL